jgi:NADH-quinone oxidoreductase subunit E
MLTAEERQEIEAEFPHYEPNRALCLDALKIVQRRHGWVSNEGLRDVAEILAMTVDEVDNVATFYNLIFREPVGEHVILMCDSITCWMLGYEDLRAHVKERLGIGLGETTPDGRFTLLPIVCLGTCDHAPAMMIDEVLYRDLDKNKLDEILDRYTSDQEQE